LVVAEPTEEEDTLASSPLDSRVSCASAGASIDQFFPPGRSFAIGTTVPRGGGPRPSWLPRGRGGRCGRRRRRAGPPPARGTRGGRAGLQTFETSRLLSFDRKEEALARRGESEKRGLREREEKKEKGKVKKTDLEIEISLRETLRVSLFSFCSLFSPSKLSLSLVLSRFSSTSSLVPRSAPPQQQPACTPSSSSSRPYPRLLRLSKRTK
jgi:hypothetical protein